MVEKAQDNIDIQMIKETIDSLEDKYSKTQVNHIVQKLRVISNKSPRTFDSCLSLYVIDAYKKN